MSVQVYTVLLNMFPLLYLCYWKPIIHAVIEIFVQNIIFHRDNGALTLLSTIVQMFKWHHHTK